MKKAVLKSCFQTAFFIKTSWAAEYSAIGEENIHFAGITVPAGNRNTRNRAAEVLVNGAEAKLIRCRKTIEQQLANEQACL